MYSRSYNDDRGMSFDPRQTSVPPGYDGTALKDESACEEVFQKNAPTDASLGDEEPCDKALHNEGSRSPLSGLFGLRITDLRLSSLLSGIGTEELLLIGLSLFLFFSKNRDRECALMIAALLFIR